SIGDGLGAVPHHRRCADGERVGSRCAQGGQAVGARRAGIADGDRPGKSAKGDRIGIAAALPIEGYANRRGGRDGEGVVAGTTLEGGGGEGGIVACSGAIQKQRGGGHAHGGGGGGADGGKGARPRPATVADRHWTSEVAQGHQVGVASASPIDGHAVSRRRID